MEDLTFGQKIRKWRKDAGLTQKALGTACGYSPKVGENTVQYWEKDEREPSIKQLRPLAEALGITLDELIP